ncbi:uncharacterized protein [Triticum aestivum]|uniref:uncharacterized protein n=1 Tax=Triticum aestivum TaxID=4565 RepID=UPI001D0198A0|nr:uncharacterized protein LOC123133601 [Triticum aestivum]
MAESPENTTAAPAAPPAPAPAPAPKPSPPARSGIPPRYDLDAKWDACLDLSIRRVAHSSLAGAFGGLILFRKLPTAASPFPSPQRKICSPRLPCVSLDLGLRGNDARAPSRSVVAAVDTRGYGEPLRHRPLSSPPLLPHPSLSPVDEPRRQEAAMEARPEIASLLLQ